MKKAWFAVFLCGSAFVVACGADDDLAPAGEPSGTEPATAEGVELTSDASPRADVGPGTADARRDDAATSGDAATPDDPDDAATPDDAAPPRDAGVDSGPRDAGVDSGPRDAAVPPACGAPNPAKGFLASVSVRVGSVTRTYSLTVPAGHDGVRKYPLVIGYHGDGGTGAGYRAAFPIEAQGGANAIFAWPNGTNNHNGHSFDQFHSPPTANPDVAFFDAMTAAIATTYCVDTRRVYVHGSSGGAYFTNQLARWRNGAIRAIAPQSGGGPFGNGASDFDPATGSLRLTGPMAAFIVHGQSDGVVLPAEGLKSLAYWRLANGSAAGDTATSPSPCRVQNGGSKRLVYCAVPGLAHAGWSSAPAAIWQFFASN